MISPDSPEGRQLGQLYALDESIRGRFLQQAIVTDGLIEDILATYFCPEEERRRMLRWLVFGLAEVTFSDKISALAKLLQRAYPEVNAAHPKLEHQLTTIRKFRNRMAHAMVDTSDEFLRHGYTDRVQLTYEEGGQRKQMGTAHPDAMGRADSLTG